MNFPSPSLPGVSFGFRYCFNLFLSVVPCFWRNRRKCNTCFSLVIFEIFTAKLATAVECTELPKLEEGHVPQCPIASDATGHIGFELGRVGNINKYCSVQSSLELLVSESNVVFFAPLV